MKYFYFQFIEPHKKIIMISASLALFMGIAAAIYPINYVARFAIQNSEFNNGANNNDYLSLQMIKRIKNRLPIEAKIIGSQETDVNLRKYIKKSILDSKWIDRNITPMFAITKADTKEIATSQNSKIDALRVEWLNVEAISKEERLAEKYVLWISNLISKVNYKTVIKKHISDVKNKSDDAIKNIYKILPNYEVAVGEMQERINILNRISQKYPPALSENTQLQLNLSTKDRSQSNSPQDDNNKVERESEIRDNLYDLTSYLPFQKQLSIVEIQLAQTIDRIKTLKLEKDVAEIKSLAAANALKKLDETALNDLFDGKKITYNFSPSVKLEKLINNNSPEWYKNYVLETKNQLFADEGIILTHFEKQMSSIESLFVEPQFDRTLLVFGGVFIGFIAPIILRLIVVTAKKLLND